MFTFKHASVLLGLVSTHTVERILIRDQRFVVSTAQSIIIIIIIIIIMTFRLQMMCDGYDIVGSSYIPTLDDRCLCDE